MTSGLEWNLKVTAQDQLHIVAKFVAEFETYWNSREFLPFNPDEPQVLRDAISHARSRTSMPPVFFEIRPHPFQNVSSMPSILSDWCMAIGATSSWRRLARQDRGGCF